MTEQQLPVRRTTDDHHHTIIHGTKTMGPRGWDYDYVRINNYNLSITVGSEQGNYGGGDWLRPFDDSYEQRLEHFLTRTEESDPNFYALIVKELELRRKGAGK